MRFSEVRKYDARSGIQVLALRKQGRLIVFSKSVVRLAAACSLLVLGISCVQNQEQPPPEGTVENQAPSAEHLHLSTDFNTPLQVNLSGSDPEDSVLTYALSSSPAHGTLSGTAPQLTYTPGQDFSGSDTFGYTVSDGSLASPTAYVFITVKSKPPSAIAQDVSVNANCGQEIAVGLSAIYLGSEPLTYQIVDQPAHGTVSLTDKTAKYQALPDYEGSDSFTYRASNGIAEGNTAVVSIKVDCYKPNIAPIADDLTVSTAFQTPVSFTLTGSDPNGDSITFEIVSSPASGTLNGTAPNLTYVPKTGFSGSDSFLFRAKDASLESNLARVTITVNKKQNLHAPVAMNTSCSVDCNGIASVELSATDADGDYLSFSVVQGPLHGTLSHLYGAYTSYTPAVGYSGEDTLTFQASDGLFTSNVGTVTITVTTCNKNAPVAQNESFQTCRGTAVYTSLHATDEDGDTLTYVVVQAPGHGTLTGSGASLTYTPAPGYVGDDTFTYQANDGLHDSNVATVTITVTACNLHAPVAQDLYFSTSFGTPVATTLVATDEDGDALTYYVTQSPLHGTLSGSGANRTYTPATGYSGQDTFKYYAYDGLHQSNIATVIMTVSTGNLHAPVALDLSFSTTQEAPVATTLNATDADGDSLTYIVTQGPTHGTLSGSGKNLTYTPAVGFSGQDSFQYKANDGLHDSNIATVTITVTKGNLHAPVAQDLSVDTSCGTAVELTLPATDEDGDSLTFIVTQGPFHGTLTGFGANRTYKPATGYSGQDTFAFYAFDGLHSSNTATVTVHISTCNLHAPVAQDLTFNTDYLTAVATTLSATDADGDALTYAVTQAPQHGVLSGSGKNLTYTPEAGFWGQDTFQYQANDGLHDSNTATVTINVAAPDLPPVATDISITTPYETDAAVLLLGSDPEGKAITYQVQAQPSQGVLLGTVPNLVYRPNSGFSGQDTFTYRVSDGKHWSNTATVTITVQPLECPAQMDFSFFTPLKQGKSYWVNFAPRLFNPNAGIYPTEAQIRQMLQQLYQKGYRGVTTFAAELTLISIPRIAREEGFEVVVMGIWDPGNRTEVEAAIAQRRWVTCYVIGSEGMLRGEGNPYTRPELLATLPEVRTRTCRPVSTAEPWGFWLDPANSDVLAAVDFVSANIYGWWEGIQDVQAAYNALVSHYQSLVNYVGAKFVLVRETGWPTGDHPAAGVDKQRHYFELLEQSGVPYVLFEAYDQYWKPETYQGYTIWWGRFDQYGNDKWNEASLLAPIAYDQSVLVAYQTPLAITLQGRDRQGDPITYQIVKQPTHGSVSGTAPNVTYTPAAGYSGPDTFQFQVSDGTYLSNTATVQVTVGPKPQHPPVAESQTVSTPFQKPVSIKLVATDPDGDQVFYNVESPAHGTLSGTAPNLVYRPAAGFSGDDSFVFRASDGTLVSDPATVTIHVGAPGTPSIVFTYVPPLGSFSYLLGRTENVDYSRYDVVVYLYRFGWWVKPTYDFPHTPIGANETWSCNVTTGGTDELASEYRAFVVLKTYVPNGNELPAAGDYIASVAVTR